MSRTPESDGGARLLREVQALRDENAAPRGPTPATPATPAPGASRRDVRPHQHTSEELFRLLVEGVKDFAIFMLDPQGHVRTWNAGAERIKGFSADEIIGQHFSRFYPPEVIQSRKPERELEIARETGRQTGAGGRQSVTIPDRWNRRHRPCATSQRDC